MLNVVFLILIFENKTQLDDGFDSQDSGIVRGDASQIAAHAIELIKKHKTDVVVQPLLSGREWTVAIAAGEPMAPVQVEFNCFYCFLKLLINFQISECICAW